MPSDGSSKFWASESRAAKAFAKMPKAQQEATTEPVIPELKDAPKDLKAKYMAAQAERDRQTAKAASEISFKPVEPEAIIREKVVKAGGGGTGKAKKTRYADSYDWLLE